MSRCRRSLRATRALCLAKSDQGERRGGGGSGTAGHPAVCCPAPHGKAHFVGFGGRRMRLSVTSPPGRCGTKPPASLRGTMENGPTGQTCSSNPPPGCGGGCAERRCRKQTGFGTFAEAATEFRSHPRCSSCGSARAKRDGLAPNDARGWECLGCGRKHGSLAGTAFEHTRRGLPGRVSLIGLMRFSVLLDCIGGRHRRLQNPCAVACGHGKPSHEEDKGGLRRSRSQRRHHRA